MKSVSIMPSQRHKIQRLALSLRLYHRPPQPAAPNPSAIVVVMPLTDGSQANHRTRPLHTVQPFELWCQFWPLNWANMDRHCPPVTNDFPHLKVKVWTTQRQPLGYSEPMLVGHT